MKTVLIAFLTLTSTAHAADRGRQIIEEAEKFHEGFIDYSTDGEMILKDSNGGETRRSLKLMVMEGTGSDQDKSLMLFSKPLDIKGTAILTHPQVKGEDDQWLYLPAIKRVKRIASTNKNGPFLGSEFSYDDLIPRVIDKYKYEYLKAAKCRKGNKCHVIISYPNDQNVPYKRYVLWIDQENYLIYRIEYFNKRNELTKIFTAWGYEKPDGKHWAANLVKMKNIKSKKSTEFRYSNFKFNSGLQARQFESTALPTLVP